MTCVWCQDMDLITASCWAATAIGVGVAARCATVHRDTVGRFASRASPAQRKLSAQLRPRQTELKNHFGLWQLCCGVHTASNKCWRQSNGRDNSNYASGGVEIYPWSLPYYAYLVVLTYDVLWLLIKHDCQKDVGDAVWGLNGPRVEGLRSKGSGVLGWKHTGKIHRADILRRRSLQYTGTQIGVNFCRSRNKTLTRLLLLFYNNLYCTQLRLRCIEHRHTWFRDVLPASTTS
jgi:hypothetical protein